MCLRRFYHSKIDLYIMAFIFGGLMAIISRMAQNTFYRFHYVCYRCDSVCKNATKRNNERCLTTSVYWEVAENNRQFVEVWEGEVMGLLDRLKLNKNQRFL